MRNFEFYRVREGTDLGDPNTLNSVFDDVDLRLGRIEETKRSWDEQVEVLVELGLERVNEVLLPAVERITRLANLGALFSARSETLFTPAPGEATFIVEESKREAFAPAWYLSITSESNPATAMAATVTSYDEVTGELVVNVVRVQGGTADDWYIAPGSATEALDVLVHTEAARDAALAAADATATDRDLVNDARAIVAQLHASAIGARDEAVDARVVAVNARTDAVAARGDAVDARDEAANARDATLAAAATTVSARDDTIAALESFPNWYLGAYATDPATGPGGIPLAEGMLYANTTHAQIRQYFTGTGWTVVYVPHDSTVASVFGRMGSVGAMAGDYSANLIARTANAGGVPGGDVEAALVAIWSAKAAASHVHAAVTTTVDGFMSAADKVKLNGVAAGATANATDAALRARSSHTGAQAISTVEGLQAALDGKAAASHTHAIANVTGLQASLDGKAAASHTHAIANVTGLQTALDGKAAASHVHAAVTTTVDGFMSAADKVKLNGVAAGATANATDAALRARSSHTGAQAISTVEGLQAALDGKAAASHTHAIANVTGLQASLDEKLDISATTAWLRSSFFNRGSAAEARVALGLNSAALQPDTAFAQAAHSHDDRYYTQAQINTQMGGKANAAHEHSADDLTSGSLPAARFTDASHGNRGGGALHSTATTVVPGFMSAPDKIKLNGIATGAQVNPSIAGPAQAIAGVNNTLMMTPLRTAEAIAALAPSGIGVGQTWQDVSGTRAKGTAFQNTSGKAIQAVLQLTEDNEFQVSENGIDWIRYALFRFQATVHAIIPEGHYYRVLNGTGTANISSWIELR